MKMIIIRRKIPQYPATFEFLLRFSSISKSVHLGWWGDIQKELGKRVEHMSRGDFGSDEISALSGLAYAAGAYFSDPRIGAGHLESFLPIGDGTL
jgi:hypothetical protein